MLTSNCPRKEDTNTKGETQGGKGQDVPGRPGRAARSSFGKHSCRREHWRTRTATHRRALRQEFLTEMATELPAPLLTRTQPKQVIRKCTQPDKKMTEVSRK